MLVWRDGDGLIHFTDFKFFGYGKHGHNESLFEQANFADWANEYNDDEILFEYIQLLWDESIEKMES